MTPFDPRDPELEAVWRAASGAAAHSIAVVAANAGEGVSSLAGALALRAALGGGRALYVNLAPGTAATPVGLAEDAILPGEPPGLGLLLRPSAASVAAWRDAARLEAQLGAWREEWQHVVFDTGPLLSRDPGGVPALSVAAAAEATVLLVLAGRTAAARVREARERLAQAGARLVGTVLNDRDNPSLLAEMEREVGRLARLAPGLARGLRQRLQRSPLLALRV
jgi:Mrp family chromosome partitioning ATPase